MADYVSDQIVEASNTVIGIEHNLDFIKDEDRVIDLGQEGDDRGIEIVAEDPPKEIAKSKRLYTWQALKERGVV